MRRLAVLLVAVVSAGCSSPPFTGEETGDDLRAPFVCGPEHRHLPCGRGVEQGAGYRFTLLTHCGVEWAYFDGRYWVPKPKVDAPSHWANTEAGTMVLERSGVALFEAAKGGDARFVPAPDTYRPPPCA
jgi:hypothetical protein